MFQTVAQVRLAAKRANMLQTFEARVFGDGVRVFQAVYGGRYFITQVGEEFRVHEVTTLRERDGKDGAHVSPDRYTCGTKREAENFIALRLEGLRQLDAAIDAAARMPAPPMPGYMRPCPVTGLPWIECECEACE